MDDPRRLAESYRWAGRIIMLRKILSSVCVSVGAAIATIFVLGYFADRMFTGGKNVGAQLGGSIDYLIASVVCIVMGAALWKKWQIPVAEFWVVAGAFSLGIAFRSNGSGAEVYGAFGLAAFAIGYLALKYNTDRRRMMFPDPRLREETMKRIMDVEALPAELAVMQAEESGEPERAASSLSSMIHELGTSVRPALEKTARARNLVGQP